MMSPPLYRLTSLSLFVVLMMATALLWAAEPADGRPAFKAGEVLVTLKSVGMAARLARELPGIAAMQRVSRNLHRIRLQPDETVVSMLSRLKRHPLVLRAQPNYIKYVQNDPENTLQWALSNISAEAAWETTTGVSTVVVAVIDTGIVGGYENTHPALINSLWHNPVEVPGNGDDDDGNGYVDDVIGINVVEAAKPSNDLWDFNGHGTMVAGVLAAQQRSGVEISGVSPTVSLMIIKAFDGDGKTTTASLVAAYEYAMNNGADIINASYGAPGIAVYSYSIEGFDELEYEAISAAGEVGILVVASAGNGCVKDDGDICTERVGYSNDGDSNTAMSPYVPASYDLDNIIAVAATDHNDHLAGFSNWGVTSVDLAAPGVSILSASLGGVYDIGDGTSYAVPHVTATLALMLSIDGDHSAAALKERLLKGVDPVAELRAMVNSGGRLNVRAALAAEVSVESRSRQLSEGGGGGGGVGIVFLMWLLAGRVCRLRRLG